MNKQAFSLAEIVVALLIISIIIAASAPLISKRQKLNNMFDCFWQENNQLEGSLSFAQGGQGTVGIGIKPDNKNYILHLRMNNGSESDKARNIAFYDKNSTLVGSIGFYGNNMYFGKGALEGENNIVLGQSNTLITGDTLSIGPLTYSAPLITGKFVAGNTSPWPYVQINGQLVVNPTDTSNQYGLVVTGDIYATKEIRSSNVVATNLLSTSILEVGNPVNNLFIENLQATNIVNDLLKIGPDTPNIINSITLDSTSIQNAKYVGTQDFSSAEIIGLKYDSSTGYIYSDRRLKDIMGDSKTGLEQIRKVKIKDYKWKDKRDKDIHIGVIAQDFEEIFPTLVKEDNKGYLRIQPIELIFVAMNAIKDLDREFQALKKELAASVQFLEYKNLVEENSRLKSEIESLKVKNKELESYIKLQNKEFTGRLEKLENILNKV